MNRSAARKTCHRRGLAAPIIEMLNREILSNTNAPYEKCSIREKDKSGVTTGDTTPYQSDFGIPHLDELKSEIQALSLALSRHYNLIRRPDLVKHNMVDAAKRLGRSRSSIYNLIAAGELVRIKEQGRAYITEEEIQRWERANRL